LQILDIVILILAAFVPSLVYLVWIRNTERFSREPYGRLIKVFAIGASLSVVVAVAAEVILMTLYNQNIERVYQLLGDNPSLSTLILACVIAPLVEEFAKAMGVFRVKRLMAEIEDGIIYGAAAGLGFAATENLLYESNAYLSDGVEAFIAVAVVRSLSSALLHASASSVFGLGIARGALQGRGWFVYYLGAVFMHSMFNLFASFGVLYQDQLGDLASLVGLTAAFVIAIGGIIIVRAKIRMLDRPGGR
jgi:RsiW-degrading membrane proteinase PrsW (M82 family)